MPQVRQIWRTNAAAAAALALAACSADLGLFAKSDPKVDAAVALHQAPTSNSKQRVVTANDLVGADGRCAGEAAPAGSQALNFTAGPQAGPASPNAAPAAPGAGTTPTRTGVALGMTECEVVLTLGHTDHIEIASNERGQRSVTLTYLQGERPGIYRFVAGQLVSLERTGDAPAAPKSTKSKKTTKQPPG